MLKLRITSTALLIAIRDLANNIANTKMDNLMHFMATRTIPIKKKDNGVRPIGVGDIFRRIVLKAIDKKHRSKVIDACANQFGNGQAYGAEAIVHTIRKVMRSGSECILTIDATNGFNQIRRSTTLDYIHERVPELFLTAFNTYGSPSYTTLKETQVSVEEGSTQGCPLAASFFNLGLAPLLEEMGTDRLVQCFYMDDGYAFGPKEEIANYWKKLCEVGPKYGYYPNNKSTVYDPGTNYDLWNSLSLNSSSSGLEVLSSPIGEEDFVEKHTKCKMDKISSIIMKLNCLAKIHPQHAYAILSRSTKNKSSYIFRTVCEAHSYSENWDKSMLTLVKTLFGGEISAEKLKEIRLPIREGGLGLDTASQNFAQDQYKNSVWMTEAITDHILSNTELPAKDWLDTRRKQILENKRNATKQAIDQITRECSDEEIRRWEERRSAGASLWLHAIPTKTDAIQNLAKKPFKDALSLWFNIQPKDTPKICPSRSCNSLFSIHHADSCAKGATVTSRHDKIKHIIARHCQRAYGQGSITIEPQLGHMDYDERQIISGNCEDGARADILIQDTNQLNMDQYLDICVASTVCETNKKLKVTQTLDKAEKRKNRDYKDRVSRLLGAEFKPMIFSSGGCMSKLAKEFIDTISKKIERKSHLDHKKISANIRLEISMSLIKSRVACVRAVKYNISEQLLQTW